MTRPVRVAYAAGETYVSGMVVEEVAAETEGAVHWPFQAARFEVPPGRTSELDVHEDAELWMVSAGIGTVRSGDTTFDVGPGAMVYFAGRVPHQVTNTGTGALRVFSVWWKGST
jgi:mannose-6-phosphate isomerase-like protein (cupin superfamily)